MEVVVLPLLTESAAWSSFEMALAFWSSSETQNNNLQEDIGSTIQW